MIAECCSITGLTGKKEFQCTYLEEKDKRDMWADCVAVMGTTKVFRMDTLAALVALEEFAYLSEEMSRQKKKNK